MNSKFLKCFFLFSIIMVAITTNVYAESKYLYDVLKNEAESGGLAKEYIGEHHDSFTEEPSKKIYHWYAENDDEGNLIQNKNNVLFGGFCWQMIRTTDTGGVKMIYNGIPENGGCNANRSRIIGYSKINPSRYVLSYVGYMHNSVYNHSNSINVPLDSVFGNDVEFKNGKYILKNTINNVTNTSQIENYHYTCFNSSGQCEEVAFVNYTETERINNYVNQLIYNYSVLRDGKKIEDIINEMLFNDDVNKNDSTIKHFIDDWYVQNLKDYNKYLQDTIFCNDRDVVDYSGWNANGGNPLSSTLKFKEYNISNSLLCNNKTDMFSTKNNYAKLKYPIGLNTVSEMKIINNHKAVEAGVYYWLISPMYVGNDTSYTILSYGINRQGYISQMDIDWSEGGVRPSISMKSAVKYDVGDGTVNNPYIIKEEEFYSIDIENQKNMKDVSIELDDVNAVIFGNVIRFKAVPEDGYEIENIKIVDAEGNEVKYREISNNKYEFTMPKSNVVITSLCRKKEISNIINPKTGNKTIILITILFLIVSTTYIIVRKKKEFS